MTLMELFSGMKRRRVEAASSAWERYRELLADAAEGVNLDAATVELALAAAGRSEADFASDVEVYKRRVKWSERVRLAVGADAEADRLEAEFAERDKKLADHIRTERLALQEIRERQQAALTRTSQALRASSELRSTCMDVGLLSEVAEVDRQTVPLAEELASLNEAIREIGPHLKAARDGAERYPDDVWFADKSRGLSGRMNDAVRQRDAVQAKLNELARQRHALSERMLEP